MYGCPGARQRGRAASEGRRRGGSGVATDQTTDQHWSGGWRLRLQSRALALGGCARFSRSSSLHMTPLRRAYADLYFLSKAPVRTTTQPCWPKGIDPICFASRRPLPRLTRMILAHCRQCQEQQLSVHAPVRRHQWRMTNRQN